MTTLVDTSLLVRPAGTTAITGDLRISIISVGELELGVLDAKTPHERDRRLARVTELLNLIPVLGVDAAVALAYAGLRNVSGRRPTNDLWIAATALAHDLPLATGYERQAKLPGVRGRYHPA